MVVTPMGLWAAAAWGCLGAGAIEAWDLYVAIRTVKGFPWRKQGEVPPAPYLVSVLLRILLGVGLAIAFVSSGQADGPVGVMAIGIVAPKVLEQIARQQLGRLGDPHAEADARVSEPPARPAAAQPSRPAHELPPRTAPTSVEGSGHAS
jgi:hypothetical protein